MDWRDAYIAALTEALAEQSAVGRRAWAAASRDLALYLAELVALLGEGKPLTPELAEAIAEALEPLHRRLARRLVRTLEAARRDAARAGYDGHRRGVERAMQALSRAGDSLPDVPPDAMLVRPNRDFLPPATLAGRMAGRQYRSVDAWIRRNEGRPVGDIAAALVANVDPDGSVGRALSDIGPRGEAVRRAVQRAGRLARDIESPRSIIPNARRLLLHETRVAFHEGDKLGMERSPAVRLVRWRTSARHRPLRSSPDACDCAELMDWQGLGEGLFHPSAVPALIHPYCQCRPEPVLNEPDAWGTRPALPSRRPRLAMQSDIAAVLAPLRTPSSPTLTPAFLMRQQSMVNRSVQTAYAEATEPLAGV